MDRRTIFGLTAFLLMIAAIVGLLVNFILTLIERKDLLKSDDATVNSTSQNLDNQWANDRIIVLSDGKG